MRRRSYRAGIALGAVLASVAAPTVASATSGGETEERTQFITSAIEDTTNDQATLRLKPAVDKDGEWARYVVTESSSKDDARRRGVNWSPKLANARGSAAVQKGWYDRRGVLHVEDTVDFTPERVVTPGPTGFPPAAASPGAFGQARYSPLVQLPGGTIINAPHIQNASGAHDKLVKPIAGRYATFQETEGFYEGKEVYYVSFDSSAPDVAALEGATFAPNLNAAPGLGSNDRKTSARSGIAPFVNGQTGKDNPNRQGLNSALLGEGDPLNVVESRPRQNEYSPLWDVHAAVWTDTAIAAGRHVLQDDFEDIEKLAERGDITGPGGSFDAIGAIVNCPVVSIED
jgi:hypothetical protein